MKVKLLAYTQNADAVCAAAGRSCYSEDPAHELLGTGDPEKSLSRIVGMGHLSVIEHASFTFSVEGVSRALTHQLVRHRIASFSQQSQRYVSMKDATYVTPPTVSEDAERLALFDDVMDTIWDAYARLVDSGVPAEDARYLLPNGCTTNITITMNARELLHFFSLRCCERAQWEIREMAWQMLAECRKAAPALFAKAGPACLTGACPEGKATCGKAREIKEKHASL